MRALAYLTRWLMFALRIRTGDGYSNLSMSICMCVCVWNITYTCYMGILYMPNRIKSLTALPAFNSIIWMWVQHTERLIVCDVDIVFEISRPASILYRYRYMCVHVIDMYIQIVCYIYVPLHSRYLFVHVANFSIAVSDFRSQFWKTNEMQQAERVDFTILL